MPSGDADDQTPTAAMVVACQATDARAWRRVNPRHAEDGEVVAPAAHGGGQGVAGTAATASSGQEGSRGRWGTPAHAAEVLLVLRGGCPGVEQIPPVSGVRRWMAAATSVPGGSRTASLWNFRLLSSQHEAPGSPAGVIRAPWS